MFGVKDLLDPPPLEVRMGSKHVHKITPGDAKQYCGPVHVNGDDVVGPGWQRSHHHHPFHLPKTARGRPMTAPAIIPNAKAL